MVTGQSTSVSSGDTARTAAIGCDHHFSAQGNLLMCHNCCAAAIEKAVTAMREMLARATTFTFEEIDVTIQARFNNRDEGPEIQWIVHQEEDSKRLLNTVGKWETETDKRYQDDDFIDRTRMSLEGAFALVDKLLPPSRLRMEARQQ